MVNCPLCIQQNRKKRIYQVQIFSRSEKSFERRRWPMTPHGSSMFSQPLVHTTVYSNPMNVGYCSTRGANCGMSQATWGAVAQTLRTGAIVLFQPPLTWYKTVSAPFLGLQLHIWFWVLYSKSKKEKFLSFPMHNWYTKWGFLLEDEGMSLSRWTKRLFRVIRLQLLK